MSDEKVIRAVVDGVADFLFEISNDEDDAPGIEEIRRRALEHWKLLRAAMTPTYATGFDAIDELSGRNR